MSLHLIRHGSLQEFQMSRNLCVHHVYDIEQEYHNLDGAEGCLPKNREKQSLLKYEKNKRTICMYQLQSFPIAKISWQMF